MAYPYFVPDNLVISPPLEHIQRGLVKNLLIRGQQFQSLSYQPIQDSLLLRFIKETIGSHVIDKLMVVCFRSCAQGDSSYIADVLKRGICLDGASYRFLGQTKCRLRGKTCYLVNDSDLGIYDFLSRFVNLSLIKGVSKQAECVGLLLKGSRQTLALGENEYSVIKDVQKWKYNFTSGCGFMTHQFAHEIQLTAQLQVTPCVVLALFQGFYGLLVIRTNLTATKVEFRESMTTFSIADEELRQQLNTFAVLDYSRPYTNGYLNIQSVMLLADRGVSHDYLKQLQEDYYLMLDNLCTSRSRAAYFLKTTGKTGLLGILQMSGIKGMLDEMEKLRETELQNMKQCDQLEGGRNLPSSRHGLKTRLRVLVPKSRIVYGVCDPYNKLSYGECYFNPTLPEEDKEELDAVNKVVVIRCPCYHPGDIRVLRVRRRQPEYSYLTDCIVFPVKGSRPHALECGGGNLGGDKFFVTWDTNLLPRWNASPYDYGPKHLVQIGDRVTQGRRSVSRVSVRVRHRARAFLPQVFGDVSCHEKRKKVKVLQELAIYFANCNYSDLFCQLDAIFMKFASAVGPSSKDCRQIHRCLADFKESSNKANREEVQKALDKYENEFKVLNKTERRVRRVSMQSLRVNLGLAKPEYKEGDDVWQTMERRAREFLDQAHAHSSTKEEETSVDESMCEKCQMSISSG